MSQGAGGNHPQVYCSDSTRQHIHLIYLLAILPLVLVACGKIFTLLREEVRVGRGERLMTGTIGGEGNSGACPGVAYNGIDIGDWGGDAYSCNCIPP